MQGLIVTLSPAEVGKHAATGDCWLIIDGKVYDVTSYLAAHPGGVSTIRPSCGKDGTQAFATKDRASAHSAYAASLLQSYYLGDLNAAIPATTVQEQMNQSQASAPPRGGEDGEDSEED
jgi:cytochrome b involved in lipid metabolism